MPAVTVNGHAIDVSVNRLSGKEHVTYDGADMSSRRNLKGVVTHEFTVAEDGADVAYEVDTSNELTDAAVSAVRRDGETVWPV